MADDTPNAQPKDTQSTTPPASASAPASAPPTPSLLTIPQFAAEIKQRRPKLADIPDDVLVRETLVRRPKLMSMVQTSEPRPKLKRHDRELNLDQQFRKSSQAFFYNHPLIREAALGAASGLGLPESTSPTKDLAKGMASTLADDPQTPDEVAIAQGNRAMLPVYRVAKGIIQQTYGYGQEAFDAIDWKQFWDNAKGGEGFGNKSALKTDESGRQVGGEHLVHAAAGFATMLLTALKGGKKVPEAGEAVARAGEKVARIPDTLTVTAQRAAGTGPKLAGEVATKAVEDVTKHNATEMEHHSAATDKHAGAVDKITEANAAADSDYHTKVERINQDFDQKIEAAKQKFADNVAEREKKVAELRGQHAEKVAAARADWVRKAYESKQAGQQAAKVAARREALEHGQKAYTKLVDENVKSTHKAVRGDLDSRWNAIRDKIGTDTPVQAPPLYQAVESARGMLAGVPADLKIFNDIVKEITEKGENVETESGELQKVAKPSIPFDDARTQYSAIGEKAYGAEGNLRRALFTLYEAYDKALTSTAESAGAGKEYGALKSDWKNYMQDWHDMRGQATGGSPLARLLKAVDDPVVAGQVLGKFGDRLMQTYAKYNKYGASPTLMSKLRDLNAVNKALPKSVRVPNMPERLSPTPEPKLPEKPPVEQLHRDVIPIEEARHQKLERTAQDRPEPKPLPEAPPAPDIHKTLTVDEVVAKVREAKAQGAEDAAESAKTLGKHDLVLGGLSALGVVGLHNIAYALPYTIARFGEMALVTSEMGQRWLSKVTPQDMARINEVLAKTPEERGPVSQAVANGLIEKAKKGEKLPPLNMFQILLNKAQMGAILRVVAPPTQGQSQSPTQSATVQ